MPTLNFAGRQLVCETGETVLDCLQRYGINRPSSCRSGTCQTCMMRATGGAVPDKASQGLKSTLREQGYFLPCICVPDSNMELADADASATRTQSSVLQLRPLGEDILEVGLHVPAGFVYRPGQFINLFRDDHTIRSYSIASHPIQDGMLSLHVQRVPDGRVSGWIHESLAVGDPVQLAGPAGDSFYVPGRLDQPLLLLGTGSGLAPLYGIVRDALHHGHSGPIYLYHGSRKASGLYLVEELKALARQHANFRYIPCVSGESAVEGVQHGRALEIALQQQPKLAGWRVYLCGNPEMVKTARKRSFMAGAAMQDIFADAFTRAGN